MKTFICIIFGFDASNILTFIIFVHLLCFQTSTIKRLVRFCKFTEVVELPVRVSFEYFAFNHFGFISLASYVLNCALPGILDSSIKSNILIESPTLKLELKSPLLVKIIWLRSFLLLVDLKCLCQSTFITVDTIKYFQRWNIPLKSSSVIDVEYCIQLLL